MTKNNYPEGLDELVEKVSEPFVKDMEQYSYYGSNYGIPEDDVADYTRALLNALAERGYVLVDAKKQEPVASLPFAILDEEMTDLLRFYECATDGEGYDVPRVRMERLAEIGLVHRVTASFYECTTFGLSVINGDFSERPAIPGRGAFPEMSERAKAEVIGWLTDAAHEAAGEDFGAGLFADHEVAEALRAIAAMLSAPTPPTQPQGMEACGGMRSDIGGLQRPAPRSCI